VGTAEVAARAAVPAAVVRAVEAPAAVAPAAPSWAGKRVSEMPPQETEAAVKADSDAEYARSAAILLNAQQRKAAERKAAEAAKAVHPAAEKRRLGP
jgi:hypothetical protein